MGEHESEWRPWGASVKSVCVLNAAWKRTVSIWGKAAPLPAFCSPGLWASPMRGECVVYPGVHRPRVSVGRRGLTVFWWLSVSVPHLVGNANLMPVQYKGIIFFYLSC